MRKGGREGGKKGKEEEGMQEEEEKKTTREVRVEGEKERNSWRSTKPSELESL